MKEVLGATINALCIEIQDYLRNPSDSTGVVYTQCIAHLAGAVNDLTPAYLGLATIPAKPIFMDKYRVDCTNEDCPWTGLSTDCRDDNVDLHCPECDGFAEPVHE